jgi:hypothetical protein
MKSKKHYKRGMNPNSHKGGLRVSKEERQLTGTSTHATGAKTEYKEFDWAGYEERMKRERPYQILEVWFNQDGLNGSLKMEYFMERYKDLRDWESQSKGYGFLSDVWHVDIQTNTILHKPNENIEGWKYEGSKPNRKDFSRDAEGLEDYYGANDDYYVSTWLSGFLKAGGYIS